MNSAVPPVKFSTVIEPGSVPVAGLQVIGTRLIPYAIAAGSVILTGNGNDTHPLSSVIVTS